MSKMILNATDVRNDFFKLVDLVAESGETIFIKKDREIKVRLVPINDELLNSWAETKKLLDETRGMWAQLNEKDISGRFEEADTLATKRIRARKW